MLHRALLTRQLTRSCLPARLSTTKETCLLNTALYWHKKIIRRQLLTLAIETSCDDTCVAVLDFDGYEHDHDNGDAQTDQQDSSPHTKISSNNMHETSDLNVTSDSFSAYAQARLLFNEKITAKNTGHGGIHPIEALDSHRANLAKLVERALLSLPVVATSRVSTSSQSTTTKATTPPPRVTSGSNVCSNPNGKDKKVFQCHDGQTRQRPDFIAVTRGPGMRSNLSCGLEMAKGLAVAWQVPLVGVHHMQAHALTPRLMDALQHDSQTCDAAVSSPSVGQSLRRHRPAFPFLTLLVSGGHTMLLHSAGLIDHKVLVSTADIAIGDALDKCGRLLLPEETKTMVEDTAFGKYLSEYAFPDRHSFNSWPLAERRRDELAKPLNKFGWQMQTPFSDTRDLTFSFASLASRTESILRERQLALGQPISDEENMMLARTVIGTAFEHLASRTIIALESLRRTQIDIKSLVVSGGVAANSFLRYYLQAMLTLRGFDDIRLVFPPVQFCTDNAAMIAWAGVEMYGSGYSSDLGIDALRKWSMDGDNGDGGILGVRGWKTRVSTTNLSHP